MNQEAEKFIRFTESLPLLDVRSPAEFKKGHVPGAHSFPLFLDEERHEVGICYKQQGRDAAVELGLKIVGPKLADFVTRAKKKAPEGELGIYCWRGGMRSGSMGWLLRTAGMKVHVLPGGYKAYRKWVQDEMRRPRKFLILGGLTGSGKTEVLQELAQLGEAVIDLEGLARHKGSAFGNLEGGLQPRTEFFENLIVEQLITMNPDQPIWLEDESRSIGQVFIDKDLFDQMRTSPLVVLERSMEDRVKHLVELYGTLPIQALADAFRRIERRLGGQHVKAAIEAIEQGDLETASKIALVYYDKAYTFGLTKRPTVPRLTVDGSGMDHRAVAKKLKTQTDQWIKEKNLFA